MRVGLRGWSLPCLSLPNRVLLPILPWLLAEVRESLYRSPEIADSLHVISQQYFYRYSARSADVRLWPETLTRRAKDKFIVGIINGKSNTIIAAHLENFRTHG